MSDYIMRAVAIQGCLFLLAVAAVLIPLGVFIGWLVFS